MSPDATVPATDRELLLEIHHDVKDLLTCKTDHEKRIRKLEGFYSYVLGAAAIIALCVPMVWDRVKTLFGGS